jgi:hypothetical protein
VKEFSMSHSNFSFLMALDADAFLGDEDERREFIESEFPDKFGSRLDDNNWLHHLAVFFKDGSYLMWPNSEPGFFAEISNEKRWHAVHRYALQCVAVDFRLFGAMPWTLGDSGNEGNQKIDGLSFDELLLEIYKQVPHRFRSSIHPFRASRPGWVPFPMNHGWQNTIAEKWS